MNTPAPSPDKKAPEKKKKKPPSVKEIRKALHEKYINEQKARHGL